MCLASGKVAKEPSPVSVENAQALSVTSPGDCKKPDQKRTRPEKKQIVLCRIYTARHMVIPGESAGESAEQQTA